MNAMAFISQKGSEWSYSMGIKPNLACYFEMEVEEVYGNRPTVPKSKYDQFSTLELRLMEASVPVHNYASVVIRLWKWWVDDMGLRTIPLNLFLGDASLRYYLKYRAKASVDLVPNISYAMALHYELEFARYYLAVSGSEEQALIEFMSIDNPTFKYWIDQVNMGYRPQLIHDIISNIMRGNKFYKTSKTISHYSQLFEVHKTNLLDVIPKFESKINAYYGRRRIAARCRLAHAREQIMLL